jgi:hypothetical protein
VQLEAPVVLSQGIGPMQNNGYESGSAGSFESGRINTLSVALLGTRPSPPASVPVSFDKIMSDPVITLCCRSSNRRMVQIRSAVK